MVTARRLVIAVAVAVGGVACGGRSHSGPPTSHRGAPGAQVTLYRDHAVVSQRVQVVIPPASTATVRVVVAAGIHSEDVYVIEQGEVTVREVRAVSRPGAPPPPAPPIPPPDPDDPDPPQPELGEPPPPAPRVPELPPAPSEVELVIGANHEGTFTVNVGYDTERITWDAAYTMTTTPARDQAVLRGAIAVRNATGIAFHDVNLWIIDAEHGPANARAAERLAAQVTQLAHNDTSTPAAVPRDLGRTDLVDGDTRIELIADAGSRPARPLKMRSVLVYDPIGTKLDHAGSSPFHDPTLGIHPAASTRVSESFEVERDLVASAGLPAGPVRLLERRSDGSLGVLGEARLFDAAARIAKVYTVPVGTAEGVTGMRERREITDDNDRKQLSEEFVISIDNKRPRPVEVVVREHLYRGQNWGLPYQTVTLPEKEGPQQVSLRVVVPANGQSKILYVVVYTW